MLRCWKLGYGQRNCGWMAKADHTFHNLGKLWTLSTVALVLTQLAWFFLLQREQLNHSETVITGHDSGNQPLKLSTWSLKLAENSAPICSTLIFARFSFLLGWKLPEFARLVSSENCPESHLTIDEFLRPALPSWPDLIKSATNHKKKCYNRQLWVYFCNWWRSRQSTRITSLPWPCYQSAPKFSNSIAPLCPTTPLTSLKGVRMKCCSGHLNLQSAILRLAWFRQTPPRTANLSFHAVAVVSHKYSPGIAKPQES